MGRNSIHEGRQGRKKKGGGGETGATGAAGPQGPAGSIDNLPIASPTTLGGVMPAAKTDELAQMEAESRRMRLEEASKPLRSEEVLALLIPQQINTIAVDDNTALRMLAYYPEWAAGTAYTVGYKVRKDGKLWRVVWAHTSQVGWEPETAASLWEQINETHSGTVDDPIPYSGNMALKDGLYYVQDCVIYKCTRDTGNPVYHALDELVRLYVEKA